MACRARLANPSHGTSATSGRQGKAARVVGAEPDPRPVSDHIEIRWPDGRIETRDDVPAGSAVLWAEGGEGSAASTR
jgi:hypothetical protein